jgi:hypothetical protein
MDAYFQFCDLIPVLRKHERDWNSNSSDAHFWKEFEKKVRVTSGTLERLLSSPVAKEQVGTKLGRIQRLVREIQRLGRDPSTRDKLASLVDHMSEAERGLREAAPPEIPDFSGKVPAEVWTQVTSDVEEIEKCYWAGAFRAGIAFAARILECVLGHRYENKTGVDPVSQKWPLGRLVQEAKDAGCLDDIATPGINFFLDCMNKCRIFGVHVKPGNPYQPGQKKSRLMIEWAMTIADELAS